MKRLILKLLNFLIRISNNKKIKESSDYSSIDVRRQLEIWTNYKSGYEGDYPRSKNEHFNTWSIVEAFDLSFKLLGTNNEIINKRLIRFKLIEYSVDLFHFYSWMTYLTQKIIIRLKLDNFENDNIFQKEQYYLDKAILEKDISEIIIHSFIVNSLQEIRRSVKLEKTESIPTSLHFPIFEFLWLKVFIDHTNWFNIYEIGDKERLINNLHRQIEYDTNINVLQKLKNYTIDHQALWNEILKEIILLLDKEIILSHNSIQFGSRVDSLIDFYGNFFMMILCDFFPPYATEEDRLSKVSQSFETMRRYKKGEPIY